MANCLTLALASMKRTSSFSFKSKFDNELCDCLQRNVTIVCQCLHKDLGFYLFMVSQHESVFEELYRVMYRAELLVMKLCCREKDSWLEIALAQACMSHREDILDIRDDLDRCWDEIVKVAHTSGHHVFLGGWPLSHNWSLKNLVWPTSKDELRSLNLLDKKLECLLKEDVSHGKLQVAKYLSERVKVVIHSKENVGLCPPLPKFPVKFCPACLISEANGMTGTLLGHGSGGSVWKMKLLSMDCAVKVVLCNDPKVSDNYQKQANKLALLSHPHVMKLLCFYWDDNEIQSWMELMDKDLDTFIKEKTGRLSAPLSMKAAVNVITQIAKGMKYLHDNGVAHRDLKSLNILVKKADNPKELCEPYLHAMVADFDQVKLFSPTSAGAMVQSIPNVGTTQWRAPEAQTLRGDGSVQMTDPKAADVYSFAMLCSEVLSGKLPFDAMGMNFTKAKKETLKGKRPPLPRDSPKLLKKLIRECWDHEPTKRPHFEEILKRLLNVQSLFLSGTLSGSKEDYDHGTSYIVPSFIKRMWPKSLLRMLIGLGSSTRMKRKRGSDIPSEIQDVSLYPHELVRSFQALYVERPTHGAEKKNVKVVMGLDLGTTHTGVAYARVSHPNEIFVIREWPMGAEGSPKTLTAIYYNAGASSSEQYLDGILWGFSAHCSYNSTLHVLEKNGSGNNSTLGFYSADLKQLFAADHASEMVSPQLGSQTRCRTGIERVLGDYFKELSKFVLHHLQETYGDEIKLEMEMLEWCITMPVNWSLKTKVKMRDCLASAGLLQITHEAMGANPLPPQLLPELEAAACYVHNNIITYDRLEPGDRFVVVDIGSGIVKSIVQHWIGDNDSGYGAKTEACDFLSDLHPQNLLENKFFHFLSTKIECFEACLNKYPSIRARLLKELEELKMSSTDPNYSLEISLPLKLANFWRENDKPIHGMKRRRNYNKLVLPNVEEFFDPLVVPILEFVERHVHRATNIKIIFLVGGYANLPILAEKIAENFRSKVDHIITPKDPGNAVSQGAVQLGLNLQDLLERDMEVAGSSSTPEGDGSVPKDDGHHRPESKDDDFHPGPDEGKGKSPIQYNPSSSSADAKGGGSTMGEGSSTSPQSGKVVVAIDFGTSCVRSANSLHTPGDYRQTTEMYYTKHEDKWKGWGLHSRSKCLSEDARQIDEIAQGVKVFPSGAFVTKFKLLLADSDIGRAISPMTPSSLTVTDIISDYLREYGKHILVNLQRGAGYDIPLEAIQWCITVPSIWDENAKQQMKDCMVRAGLVRGPTNNITGSLHPVILILEPEAASVGIASTLNLEKGDKFLVADIGAGTTDVVVQEWLGDSSEGYKMKEVCKSVGGLCGSSIVDNNFLAFLSLKVGPWLTGYSERFPSFRLEVLQAWEPIKCNYSVYSESPKLQFPPRLVAAAREEGHKLSGELALLQADMEMIFDPVVEMIKDLIATQLSQVGNIKTIVLVGGFSRSSYLRTKIREKFWMPGWAPPLSSEDSVVNGALNMAFTLGGPVSRISRTTYGLGLSLESEGVSPLEDHVNLAKETECGSQIFRIDVLEGECVQEDSCVYSVHTPVLLGQKTMKFTLYSSSDVYPRYTDEESVTKQWDFVIDISEFAEASTKPEVGVSIFYGRSCVEVEAVALFGAHKQLPVNIIVGARISNTTRNPSDLSTKTYGLGTSKILEAYDPLEYRINPMDLCRNRFEIFIPRGMQLDACVARAFSPVECNQKILKFTMYSTHEVSPRYTTDEAMEREWGFEVQIFKDRDVIQHSEVSVRLYEVSIRLYITRAWIEVSAVGVNFGHPNRDLKVKGRGSDTDWKSSLIFSTVDRPFLRACMGATTSRMNVQPGFYIHEFHQQQKFGNLSGRQKVVDFQIVESEDYRYLEWMEREIFEDIIRPIRDGPHHYGSSFG